LAQRIDGSQHSWSIVVKGNVTGNAHNSNRI
jgi:hypothetical protein